MENLKDNVEKDSVCNYDCGSIGHWNPDTGTDDTGGSLQLDEDCKNNVPTEAIEQVALDIIITAGLVSNFTVHENNPNPEEDYYYNSSLAHCVYYGASLFPQCERQHLHGEIVSFGVLCLLTYDGQFEERNRIFEFNRSHRTSLHSRRNCTYSG